MADSLRPRLAERIEGLAPFLAMEVMERAFEMEAAGEDVVSSFFTNSICFVRGESVVKSYNGPGRPPTELSEQKYKEVRPLPHTLARDTLSCA